MTIRKILLPLTGATSDQAAAQTAFVTARTLGAHVEGLFVRPDPITSVHYLGFGMDTSGRVFQDILDAANEAADKNSAATQDLMRVQAGHYGFEFVEGARPPGTLSASFHEMSGQLADIVSRHGRLADLLVFGADHSAANAGLREAFTEALTTTGRPILLAPNDPKGTIGSKITVGWDGSAESANAVHAALPFLARADQIQVITIDDDPLNAEHHQKLGDYLAYHGIACAEHTVKGDGGTSGKLLLDLATGAQSDLLIMGGYGHNRVREFLLGGVTRHVLLHTTIPVLFAH